MRQAFSQIMLLRNEDETAFGLALGWDYAGEHQSGMSDLAEALGIGSRGKTGIPARQVNPERFEGAFHFLRDFRKRGRSPEETRLLVGVRDYLSTVERYFATDQKTCLIPQYHRRSHATDPELITAWNSRSFLIRAFTAETREMVHDIHQALKAGTLVLGLERTPPFGHGLTALLPDRMDTTVKEALLAHDLDLLALEKATQALGIERKLASIGEKWSRVKSRWTKPEEKATTACPVMIYCSSTETGAPTGWQSVEDLEDWIESKRADTSQRARV